MSAHLRISLAVLAGEWTGQGNIATGSKEAKTVESAVLNWILRMCAMANRREIRLILVTVHIAVVWCFLPSHLRSQPTAEPDSAGPLWPLTLSERYLTSNFMEHRNGRFHTGLDLKTNSRSGYTVLAAEDGWVARLRTSPFGYGRAIYIEGLSGHIYVYAHLSRFADKLRKVVRDAQRRKNNYSVDLSLQENRIPISRGELIALTGESGTSGPHLHFEVRNAAQQPLNPLACGFAVPDSLPPVIRKMRVLPASPESRIFGDLSAHSVTSRTGLQGELPPLVIQGPVAFSAEVLDLSDLHRHRLTPYSIAVWLDSSLVYRSTNDSLSFRQNRQMPLEWLEMVEVGEMSNIREKWLHRRPENSLPGRSGDAWSMPRGGLVPGSYLVRVQVQDWSGNEAEVNWDLHVLGKESPPPVVDGEGWQVDPARVSLPEASDGTKRWLTPFLVVEQSASGEWSAHDAVTGPARESDRRLVIGPTGIQAKQTILWLQADSLLVEEVVSVEQNQGLEAIGPAVVVIGVDRYNWDSPLVSLLGEIAPPESLTAVGVYRQHSSGRWDHVETPLLPEMGAENLTWHIPVPQPGRYALFRDRLPPELRVEPGESLRVRLFSESIDESNQVGLTMPHWNLVSIPLFDSGSGLDPDSINLWCDGKELIVEPDPIRDRLLLELPADLPPGEHELILHAADYAGNSCMRSLKLLCLSEP